MEKKFTEKEKQEINQIAEEIWKGLTLLEWAHKIGDPSIFEAIKLLLKSLLEKNGIYNDNLLVG